MTLKQQLEAAQAENARLREVVESAIAKLKGAELPYTARLLKEEFETATAPATK